MALRLSNLRVIFIAFAEIPHVGHYCPTYLPRACHDFTYNPFRKFHHPLNYLAIRAYPFQPEPIPGQRNPSGARQLYIG